MAFTRRQFSLSLAATIAMPAVLRKAYAQGATVKIGMVLSITGPAAESGKYALIGTKIALERINKAGGVLGKQVVLITEDDQTTNPGAVLAFSKLATQTDIVAFFGPSRSTQMHALAPDLLKVGKPVMFGGTDPALTKLGNRWLFRCRPNDSYSGRVIATYGAETLGKKNWAIVHSTDAFGTNGGKALTESLGKVGAAVAIDQGYPNQNPDFTPVVLAIKQSGADIIGSYFTFENDLAIFARQLRQLGITIPWIGSPTIVSATAVKLAGPALHGTFGVADYAEEANDAAREFGKLYRAASGGASPDFIGSWPYDAAGILCMAINNAGSTDPEKIRVALLATQGYKGAEGEYNFDVFGDGLHGYNIVCNEKGTIVFDNRIEFAS
jgi:branched-chain amino acid transport system substrate-binding protein